MYNSKNYKLQPERSSISICCLHQLIPTNSILARESLDLCRILLWVKNLLLIKDIRTKSRGKVEVGEGGGTGWGGVEGWRENADNCN